MRGTSTIEPAALERERKGRVVVRYNITETTIDNGEGESQAAYTYDEAVTYEPVTADKILEAVLAEEYGNDYELKLVNDYNAVQLGLSEDTDGSIAAKYTAYLEARAALKSEIDTLCAANNID